MRSPTEEDFTLLTSVSASAVLGALTEPLAPGPVSRFDHANALVVDLYAGALTSVTDAALFGGANALAIESAPGNWGSCKLAGPSWLGPTAIASRACCVVSEARITR